METGVRILLAFLFHQVRQNRYVCESAERGRKSERDRDGERARECVGELGDYFIEGDPTLLVIRLVSLGLHEHCANISLVNFVPSLHAVLFRRVCIRAVR